DHEWQIWHRFVNQFHHIIDAGVEWLSRLLHLLHSCIDGQTLPHQWDGPIHTDKPKMVIRLQEFHLRTPPVLFLFHHVLYFVNVLQKHVTVAYAPKQVPATPGSAPMVYIR